MELPNFDNLVRLAHDSPQQLETLRKHLIQDAIAQAAPAFKGRLRGLQFQIDMQRQLHKHPLGACVKISAMMHRSAQQLIDQIQLGALQQHQLTATVQPLHKQPD